MKYALVNPRWTFEGSTYFGCPDAHFPLELLSAREFLRAAGHDVLLVDALMEDLTPGQVARRLDDFAEDFLVVPTAPSYLFWRCPQPELRVPRLWIAELDRSSRVVVIGPHGSVTPRATLDKTGADIVLRGEPDQTLPQLASLPWEMIPGCCWRDPATRAFHSTAGLGAVDMQAVPTLDYSDYPVERHSHLHHIFRGNGADHLHRGAEVEFARGCPYACTFCNKTLFRNKYRERTLDAVLAEIDQLIARGVDYIYFIDEIFGVGKQVRTLLEEIARRPVSIGFQTRIDLWDEAGIDLLARAHCVSFECGVESITDAGRDAMNKNCRITTGRITDLLLYARQRIPWVQANLIKVAEDDPLEVAEWQQNLKRHRVWVSEPVPMFPFPGSPEYVTTFGAQPDEAAWERAHAHYLELFSQRGWSDIQEQAPLSLAQLEAASPEFCMRVLLTTDTIGGVWTFTEELASGLLAQGHSVALVSFGRAPSAAQLAWGGRMSSIYAGDFFYLPSRTPLEWMDDNRLSYVDAAETLVEVARWFAPDLLHSSQFCFGRLPLAVPKIVTAHSDVFSWGEACRPDGLLPSPWLNRYSALVQEGLDGADVVVAPTVWMGDALARHFAIRCRRVVLHNGRTLPAALQLEARALQAVSAGRLWDEAKAISTLSCITSPMPLLVAGEVSLDSDSMPSALDGLRLLGPLSEQKVLRLFRTSSIYLATSIYEPFGLAPLEAALCGCAIVARDLPSLREVWGNAATYFTHPARLQSILQAFSVEPAMLHRAQRTATRRAAQLTGERMTGRYLALYQELLGTGRTAVSASAEELTSHAV